MEGKHSVVGLDPQSALVFVLVFLPGLVGVPPSERVVFLVESTMVRWLSNNRFVPEVRGFCVELAV